MWHDISISRLMPVRLLILIFIVNLLACNEENSFPAHEEQWELINFTGKVTSHCFEFTEDKTEPKKKLIFTELTGLEDQVYERIYIRLLEPDQFTIVKTNRVVMAGSMQMFGDSMVWQYGQEYLRFKILFQSPDSLKLHTAGDHSSIYDVSLTFIKE
jgi:hypothetical protein